MLFNTIEFIFIFLPFTLFIYYILKKNDYYTLSKAFLVGSSLIFYSYWNIKYLPIILVTIFVNYYIGIALIRERDKHLLILGIVFNVVLLGYFKYSDFFIENFNQLLDNNVGLLNLALPLAISFFTFQQIIYLVDCYRGEVKSSNLLDYMLFVTFFPQLIAGPIVHHKEMMPQFAEREEAEYGSYEDRTKGRNFALGLFIFAIGLFKKVIIADTFEQWANMGFDVSKELNFIEGWITSLSYTFQIYFDFSGYTDMAIGIALLFAIKLPMNFNSPYRALNIQDFWRRWHITLSRFLRDYVCIPLGGNIKGSLRVHTNLILTFLIGGIWHGTGWGFVIWGLLHGIALSVHKIWRGFKLNMPKVIAWFITFLFINISWVFFRAENFNDAKKVLGAMFNFENIVLPTSLESDKLKSLGFKFDSLLINLGAEYSVFIWLFAAFIVVILFKNSMARLHIFKPNIVTLIVTVAMFVYALLSLNNISEFIYFNF